MIRGLIDIRTNYVHQQVTHIQTISNVCLECLQKIIKCSERIQVGHEIYVTGYFICRLTKSDFSFGLKITGSKYASGFEGG